MGTTTMLEGEFLVTPAITDDNVLNLLKGLENAQKVHSRKSRAKLNEDSVKKCSKKYSSDESDNDIITYDNDSLSFLLKWIDDNKPPYHLHEWIYDKKSSVFRWSNSEKVHTYVECLKYLIEKILKPNGYTLNGTIAWNWDYTDHTGNIVVDNNNVSSFCLRPPLSPTYFQQ